MMRRTPTKKSSKRQPHTRMRECCNACNHKRVKCSRTRPSCDRCIKAGHKCIYEVSRRAGRKPGSLDPPQIVSHNAQLFRRGPPEVSSGNARGAASLNHDMSITVRDCQPASEFHLLLRLTPVSTPGQQHDSTPNPAKETALNGLKRPADHCLCSKRYIDLMSRHPTLSNPGAGTYVEDSILISDQALRIMEMSAKCKGRGHGSNSFCFSSLLLREQLLNLYNKIQEVVAHPPLSHDFDPDHEANSDEAEATLSLPSSGLKTLSVDSEDSKLAIGDVEVKLEPASPSISANFHGCNSPVPTPGNHTTQTNSDAKRALELLMKNLNAIDEQMTGLQRLDAQQQNRNKF